MAQTPQYPIEAMREAINTALLAEAGIYERVPSISDAVARAAWKQALAELDERVRVVRSEAAASFLDDASIEIIGE